MSVVDTITTHTIIALDADYKIAIYKKKINAMSCEASVILVEIEHPNSGWGPWFMLYNIFGSWKFVQLSTATERWVKKVLKDVETISEIDEWKNQK